MIKRVVYYVFTLSLPMIVLCIERGSRCTTPNGEVATCVAVRSCEVIKAAINIRAIKAIEFVKASQCGYDTEPLVCCGKRGYKSTKGSSCLTPDGEWAICEPLSTCKIISEAVKIKNKDIIDYARKSQCGYDDEPLVCCGSKSTASIVSFFFPNATSCGFSRPKPGRLVLSEGKLLTVVVAHDTRCDDNDYACGDGVGGLVTRLSEHPWMALLRYVNNDGSDAGFKCGGTLINKRYVLTAAHCVIINSVAGFDLHSVRLGEWRISTKRDCEQLICADPVVDLKIEKEIVHQNYNRRKGKHDIALLRLERNVAITDTVRPVCLPPPEAPEPELGTILSMIGWGETENGSLSDVKLEVLLPLVSRSVCVAKIRTRDPVNEDQLCAGGEQGKDSCFGDSGGPLLRDYEFRQWYQEGIVSFGVACGFPGIPAVYTRVSRYIIWMIENMSEF